MNHDHNPRGSKSILLCRHAKDSFHPSPGRVLCNSIVKKDGWLFGCVVGADPRMTSENCQGLESKSTQCKIYFVSGKHHSAGAKRSVLKILRYHPFYLKYYRVSTYVVAFHEDSLHWGVAHQSLFNELWYIGLWCLRTWNQGPNTGVKRTCCCTACKT